MWYVMIGSFALSPIKCILIIQNLLKLIVMNALQIAILESARAAYFYVICKSVVSVNLISGQKFG